MNGLPRNLRPYRPYRGAHNIMPNRTLCSVLHEMRECCKTSNYSYLPGLIEEAQSMGNRMEAALYDKGDLESARKDYNTVIAAIKELRAILPEGERKSFDEKTYDKYSGF